MGFLGRIFTKTPRVPKPDTSVTLGMVKNQRGRFAVILQRGKGYNPGSFIQEINLDGTFSRRDPYWISGNSTNWRYGGQAEAIRSEANGDIFFRLTKVKRYHEHTEVFPQPVAWIVFVKSPNGTIEKHEIEACSSKDARDIVIKRIPPYKGMLLSGCMLKSYYRQVWL